jgi:hypothetical protein
MKAISAKILVAAMFAATVMVQENPPQQHHAKTKDQFHRGIDSLRDSE